MFQSVLPLNERTDVRINGAADNEPRPVIPVTKIAFKNNFPDNRYNTFNPYYVHTI